MKAFARSSDQTPDDMRGPEICVHKWSLSVLSDFGAEHLTNVGTHDGAKTAQREAAYLVAISRRPKLDMVRQQLATKIRPLHFLSIFDRGLYCVASFGPQTWRPKTGDQNGAPGPQKRCFHIFQTQKMGPPLARNRPEIGSVNPQK